MLRIVPLVSSCLQWTAAASATSKINDRDALRYIWIQPGVYVLGSSQGDQHYFDWDLHRTRSKSNRVLDRRDRGHFTGTNPSRYRGLDPPVDQVNCNNANAYCKAIGMRLPTEAEWEHAARAGVSASRYSLLDSIAW